MQFYSIIYFIIFSIYWLFASLSFFCLIMVRNSAPLKKYALVRWVSGPSQGTLTYNVDTDWIQDLNDDDDFSSDESYIVEWRVPPKPQKGWPLYDGAILDISTDLKYLKRKEREEEEKEKEKEARLNIDTTSQAFREAVAAAVAQALAAQSPETPLKSRKPAGTPETPKASSQKVLVGNCLYVDEAAYFTAKHANTPGTAVAALLRQAFSRKRLSRSSYAGQSKTINGGKVVKPGLKKYAKMRDIENFIKSKFPTMTQSAFCITVGRYLGEKANMKPAVEYVDTSGSEEEDDGMD